MIHSRILAALALAGLLGACSATVTTTTPGANGGPAVTVTTTQQQDPVAAIATITVDDLQAALADAQANNDVISVPCWTALIPVVQGLPGQAGSLGGVKGAFSAIQKKRDLQGLAKAGIPNSLKLACGPLLADEVTTLNALLIKLGVGAALPGIGGVIGVALP